MLDHVGIFVSKAEDRVDFYEQLLAPLGYVKGPEFPGAVCFQHQEDGDGIWIMSPKSESPLVPVHVAIRATSVEDIKAFHEAGLAAGGIDNGGPGPRSHYHPGYYAAFVHDPDGNNIEAVLHDYQE